MDLNAEKNKIEKQFFDLCSGIVESESLVLYDLQFNQKSSLLKMFIMDEKTGSAVIEDCMRVDRAMTEHIENSDWMPDELTLEVSSPGIFRDLKTEEHFKTAIGQEVRLVLSNAYSEETEQELPKELQGHRKIVGCLLDVMDDGLTLLAMDEFRLFYNFKNIKKANLEPKLH
jgi:ribosome maturation factor RimP